MTSLHLRLAICGDTFQVYTSVHDLVMVEAGERSDIETDTDVVTVVREERSKWARVVLDPPAVKVVR